MEKKESSDIGNVMHSINNTLGSARGRFMYFKDHPEEFTDEEKSELANHKPYAIKQLKRLVGDKPSKAMQDFIAQLEASDWSTLENLLTFQKNVYAPFTATPEKEKTAELRNSLFTNPLK
ncbi:MAG: hypothetical protein WD963_02505 [Candidatus Paceibacterota bacterium]